ncbi:MAG: hypothetical protein ACI9HK_004135 [Pirellulaceae bacterium]|jgi:hypothetical protein
MARLNRTTAQLESKTSRQRNSLPRRRRRSRTRRLEFQPLEARELLAAAVAGSFAITEINYNPYAPLASELDINGLLVENDFEFIEFQNVSSEVLELANVHFTLGLSFNFSDGTIASVNPGEYVLAVRNKAAFEIRYGVGLPVAGEFVLSGLGNTTDQLTMVDANGVVIHTFIYTDGSANGSAFPTRADGFGSSLEVKDVAGDYNDGDNYRNSRDVFGSPGALGSTNPVDIVINELVSHTDPPLFDSIELFNASDGPVDISNWYLSDEDVDYLKFQIPANTTLQSGEYLVFDEREFRVGVNAFALDAAHGDTVFLLSADANGRPLQFINDASLPATLNGQSFGRWPTPKDNIVRLESRTLGEANSQPAVGPLVISEVMYGPPLPTNGLLAEDAEFIEIYNPQNFAVADLDHWQLLDGIDFAFPAGESIPAHGIVVVVSFDPNDSLNAAKLTGFRNIYGIDASVKLLGPYNGRLRNEGEHVWLSRPDDPPLDAPPDELDLFPATSEDTVDYNDKSPWPIEANELGQSLTRVGVGAWGNDASGWLGRLPTPGSVALAFDDLATTTEDNATTFNVVANDGILDHNGTTSFARQFLSVLSVVQPTNGTAVVQNDDENIRYTPSANFSGTDSFTYTVTDGTGGRSTATVTVTVSDTNDPPQASNDSASATEDTVKLISASTLLQNDTDLDDANLVVTNVVGANHATVSLNGTTITYTPEDDYFGTDSFTYTVSDQRGGTDTAIVQVTIAGVNDAPVASNDTASGTEDTDLSINIATLLSNDGDAENNELSIIATTDPSNGTVTAINATQLRYRPQSNFNGNDQFRYTLSDGFGGTDTATVQVSISAVNDSPVGNNDTRSTNEDEQLDLTAANLLQNDTDIDGNQLVLSGVAGTDVQLFGAGNSAFVRYTPADNFFGTHSFTYTLSDGNSGTATATVTVNVSSVNDPPTLGNDSATVLEDSTANPILVLANDSFAPDTGESLSILSATTPSHGSVSIFATTIHYTPIADFAGNDSFGYTVSDGIGGTESATVSVTVSGINDPPTASDDNFTVAINNTDSLDVTANDSILPDSGETFILLSVTSPSQGGAAVISGDEVIYTPPTDYSGPEQFSYTVSDGNGGTDTATVSIDVQIPLWQNPVNRFDTDESTSVIPRDVLLVINAIIDRGLGALPTERNAPDAPEWLIDVNGNGRLDFLDAIQLINYLNFEVFGLYVRPIQAEGERIDVEFEGDEPEGDEPEVVEQAQAKAAPAVAFLLDDVELDETVELLARDQVENEKLNIDLLNIDLLR